MTMNDSPHTTSTMLKRPIRTATSQDRTNSTSETPKVRASPVRKGWTAKERHARELSRAVSS